MAQSLNFKYSSILADSAHDLRLSEQGYTILPLLGEEEIKQLSEYYFANQAGPPDHFYSSSHSKDLAFRKSSSDFLKNIVSPSLSKVLKKYRVLGGAFVVKPANGKGVLAPHQDWNIVDEEKYRSYNVWIPLIDVNPENGAVFVLDSSHRKLKTYRGPGIPSLFKNIEAFVWENLKPLPMKAGEALIYDHALIHASPNNKTDQIRLGIVVGVIPENAEMQLYFGNKGEIKAYKATEHFFLEKDPINGPDGLTFLNSMGLENSQLDVTQFETLYLKKHTIKIKKWLQKIVGLG